MKEINFSYKESDEKIEKAINSFAHKYSGKIILAPMVRICTLPMRLLALDYGADLVYTEELIDYRLLRCQRIENAILGTVDFVDEKNEVVFRTCSKETDRLILQMGTCNSERALKAANLVKKDVSGIDVNMGCPKEFSLKGGMGAALLSQPAKIEDILSTLVQNLYNIPVTCKIRVFSDMDATLSLAKVIQACGVSALAVHGRTKEERPQHQNRNEYIRFLADNLYIPIIANGGSGEINTHEDIKRFQQKTGASSVMVARAAEKNCSIFSSHGMDDLDSLIIKYLRYAIEYDNPAANTKYCIQQMLGSLQDSEKGHALLSSYDMEDICAIWNLKEAYSERQSHLQGQHNAFKRSLEMQSPIAPKRMRQGSIEHWEMDIKYFKNWFEPLKLPKTVLFNWAKKLNQQPSYETIEKEKTFFTVVTVNGDRFFNSLGEKNKRNSEQAAALVAGIVLGIIKADHVIEKSAFYSHKWR